MNCLYLNIWFQIYIKYIYINQIQLIDFRKHMYIHKHYIHTTTNIISPVVFALGLHVEVYWGI